MKIILVFSILSIITHSCIAQSDRTAYFDRNEKFETYLERYLNDSVPPEVHNLCLQTSVFVKFRIGTDGSVKEVATNAATPAVLDRFIRKAVLTTNGAWKPSLAAGKRVVSEYFLQPVIINNCNKGEVRNMTLQSVHSMLVFDREEDTTANGEITLPRQVAPLPCIILNPVLFMGHIK